MSILNIHFVLKVKSETPSLRKIAVDIVKNYSNTKLQVNRPVALEISTEQYKCFEEGLLVAYSKVIEYSEVIELSVEITAKINTKNEENELTSFKINATLASEKYLCFTILHDYYVCALKCGSKIIEIPKLSVSDAIFDSIEIA